MGLVPVHLLHLLKRRSLPTHTHTHTHIQSTHVVIVHTLTFKSVGTPSIEKLLPLVYQQPWAKALHKTDEKLHSVFVTNFKSLYGNILLNKTKPPMKMLAFVTKLELHRYSFDFLLRQAHHTPNKVVKN